MLGVNPLSDRVGSTSARSDDIDSRDLSRVSRANTKLSSSCFYFSIESLLYIPVFVRYATSSKLINEKPADASYVQHVSRCLGLFLFAFHGNL